MKLLHTSDWHLGRTLYGKRRYPEFAAFLDWLVETVHREAVEVLLVAGDIFDSSTPGSRAQELYYRFLCRMAAGPCRHVVLIAGNHDSPSFLDAPRGLLKALDVHVVGNPGPDPEQEVLVLNDRAGAPELIVCAVPYLRDGDIRVAQAGESPEEKQEKLVAGIHAHYAAVAELAKAQRDRLGGALPIVALGHLFAAGGRCVEGDGVRELHIGSLAQVPGSVFPACFDYVALGHLHVPQRVGGREHIRYSGSPLAMGFGEAEQRKTLWLVTLDREKTGSPPDIRPIEVPCWQRLVRIAGDWEAIDTRIRRLAASGFAGWLEIVYEGDAIMAGLRERLDALLADCGGESTGMEILRIKNTRLIERVLGQEHSGEALETLHTDEVFERCLRAHQVPEEQRAALLQTYGQALSSLQEEDVQEQG